MGSTIHTCFRSVSHTALSLLFATMLVGCATTATIDEEERNTLAKAPSVSMVLYPHVPFIASSTGSQIVQGFARYFGALNPAAVTANPDAKRGRDLIQRHRLPDPSTLVIDYFSAGLTYQSHQNVHLGWGGPTRKPPTI